MDNMASSELDVMETSMMSQSSGPLTPEAAGSSLSMRRKAQLKRRVNKEHNTNFTAGYVAVQEPYLHKAGLRGRKRFLLYSCFVFLFLLALLNTALTAWLMWIYHITHTGIGPLEFSRSWESHIIRFLQPTRFQSLLMNGAFLGGRINSSLAFTGTNSKFVLNTSESKNKSKIEIRQDLIRFSVDDLKLVTQSGKPFFSLDTISKLSKLKNFHASEVNTREIKNAPNYKDLSIESWLIDVSGSAGVQATSSKEMEVQANNLYVNPQNSTIIEGGVGVYVSQMIPRVRKTTPTDPRIINAKLCVCASNGRLFVVPVARPGMGCATASETVNPCLL